MTTLVSKDYNKYDWIIILITGSLAFGAIGGAFQVIRIISILLLPFNILSFKQKKSQSLIQAIYFGCFWMLYGISFLLFSNDLAEDAPFQVLYIFLYLNICYSLVRFSKKSKQPVRSLLWGWLVVFVATLPIAIWEIITDNHLYLSKDMVEVFKEGFHGIDKKKFAAATYVNYNEYVNMLSVGLPYLFFSILIEKNKSIPFFILAITIIVLAVNASRGGIMCLAIDFIIFLVYATTHLSTKYKRRIYLFLFIGFLGVLCYGDVIFNQLLQRAENGNIGEDEGRIKLIMKAINVMIETYGIGVGPSGITDAVGYAPHNMWTEILGDYGIIIFVWGFLLISSVWKRSYKKSKGSVYGYLPIATLFSLPFYICINSTYLTFSFIWIAIASFYIVNENI